MRLTSLFTAGLALLFGFGAHAQAPAPAPAQVPTLQAGADAPNFTLPGSDGKTYTLADFKGKSAVVLAWFPKAFTAG
jgi:cytochrome oxidase Cu insertion factor (SCO1/SenC/PrrC family)